MTDNLKQDIDLVDGALHVADAETIRMVYHLLDRDGLYVGASTALNVVAAKKLAEKLGKGSRVVTILCDGAYRYALCSFARCGVYSSPGPTAAVARQVPVAAVLEEVARVEGTAAGDPGAPPEVCRPRIEHVSR